MRIYFSGGLLSLNNTQTGGLSREGKGPKVAINLQGSGNIINISGELLHFSIQLFPDHSEEELVALVGQGMSVVKAAWEEVQ